MANTSTQDNSNRTSLIEIYLAFLRLGLTAFGGPVAHLAYFRDEFVVRRQWLSERSYADLVALCQFLPGPASSQVGFSLGLLRGGYWGALVAWLGFTLPSALLLILFALMVTRYASVFPPGVLHGLKVVVVAVVAQAVWGMARSLCPDGPRITIMTAATCLLLLMPWVWAPALVILMAAVVGLWLLKNVEVQPHEQLSISVSRRVGSICLLLFIVILAGLPLVYYWFPFSSLQLFDAFYRAGALVFGGGHVVLPLLQAEVVGPGWVDEDVFVAGYGAAQAVPGPLFTFAAYLGASIETGFSAWWGALLSLVAIFLPSFLLVTGVLPFWGRIRQNPYAHSALLSVNAAVVGILLAALYQPLWSGTVKSSLDFALVLIAFVSLVFWKLPPWLVVIFGGIAGWLLQLVF